MPLGSLKKKSDFQQEMEFTKFFKRKNTPNNLERCLRNADRNIHTFIKLDRAPDNMRQNRSLCMQARV